MRTKRQKQVDNFTHQTISVHALSTDIVVSLLIVYDFGEYSIYVV